jgi:hypothetical protein
MVAFGIYLNGAHMCTAGIGELGVLTACVTWSGHRVEKLARLSPPERIRTRRVDDLDLDLVAEMKTRFDPSQM